MRPETTIQRVIRADLDARGYRSVAVPNGAVLAGSPKQKAIQMASLKRDGLMVGFPDLIVFGPGCIGFIEVKVGGGKQSDHQRAVQKWMMAWDHPYAVCRSVQDVAETLARWGWQDRVADSAMLM